MAVNISPGNVNSAAVTYDQSNLTAVLDGILVSSDRSVFLIQLATSQGTLRESG